MNPAKAPKAGSHWADAQGRKVYFYSRNRKAKTVIWHPRFYFWYRTTVDALKAKHPWEEKHRILFPDDLKPKQPMKRKEKQKASYRAAPRFQQEELRL